MAAGAEDLEAQRWIIEQLQGDSTLMTLIEGVFSETVPVDVTFVKPVIKVQYIMARDQMVVDGRRLTIRAMYRVVVVSKGPSLANLPAPVKRMDQVLHRGTGSTADLIVLSCIRQYPYRFTERDQQETYVNAGGVYEIQAQAT